MLRCELAPVGLGDQPPLGDADQGVVGLVVVFAGKIRLVAGDQRDASGVGELDQPGLHHALFARSVALQLDIEPIIEQPQQRIEARAGALGSAVHQLHIEAAIRAAGEGDQPVGLALEPGELDVRPRVGRGSKERARRQLHQPAIAVLARREQHQPRQAHRVAAAGIAVVIAEVDRKRAPDDRLDADARHLLGELERAEHVVGVGERERGLPVGLRQFGEPRDRQRAFEQRVGRVNVQVDEAGVGAHGRASRILAVLGSRAPATSPPNRRDWEGRERAFSQDDAAGRGSKPGRKFVFRNVPRRPHTPLGF